MKKIAILYDEIFLKHKAGDWHPESPYRLEAILRRISEPDLKDLIEFHKPERATKEEILWNHTEELYDLIASTSGKPFFSLDPDTATNEYSFEAALYAAGAQKKALNLLLGEDYNYAFALVRPPGHHAEKDRAMGFCLFNNVALAALYAKHYYNLKRILIVDFDLHHGNGTQRSFYDDPEVLFFSTHQFPHYPGTGNYTEIGVGIGRGYTINVPLKGQSGDEDFLFFYKYLLEPIALQYKPEIVLVSAGFDSLQGDPLGSLQLTFEGLSCMIKILQKIAENSAQGKILFTLEGGYNLKNLSEGVATILFTLAGSKKTSLPDTLSPSSYAQTLYNKLADLLNFKNYWEVETL
jgi:acetoin utilization deacetylase AcuC-like enzyme